MLEDLKLRPCYDGFLFLAESARNPPRLNSHHHVELEINLIVEGSVTYVVSGKRLTFPKRTLLWFFPTQEHQLVDRSHNARYYVAVFKPDLIERSCKSAAYAGLLHAGTEHNEVLHTQLEPESFDLLRKTMDSLMEGSLDPDLLNREAGFGVGSDFHFEHGDPDGLNAGLHHLLLLCWRCRTSGKALGKPVALHPAVKKALDLLAAEERSSDLANIAKRCGVSSAYLSRVFGNQIGVPLNRYRNSLRLSRFWDQYRAPQKRTLMEMMYAAGFGSYAQFYKVFSEAYGCGPRECLNREIPTA